MDYKTPRAEINQRKFKKISGFAVRGKFVFIA